MSLRLLGGFELRVGSVVAVLPLPAKRVLAFLALHHRPMTRSHVSQSLWLDVTEKHADGNLRYTVCKIGKVGLLLHKTGGYLALSPLVKVDLHHSTALANRLEKEPESLRESELDETLLSDDLLPDWHEEWIVREQDRYRQLRLHALENLCMRLISLARFGRAIQAALAAAQADPLAESARLVLLRAYIAKGNLGEALRQYRLFGGLLKEELGVSPSLGFEQEVENMIARQHPFSLRQ